MLTIVIPILEIFEDFLGPWSSRRQHNLMLTVLLPDSVTLDRVCQDHVSLIYMAQPRSYRGVGCHCPYTADTSVVFVYINS